MWAAGVYYPPEDADRFFPRPIRYPTKEELEARDQTFKRDFEASTKHLVPIDEWLCKTRRLPRADRIPAAIEYVRSLVLAGTFPYNRRYDVAHPPEGITEAEWKDRDAIIRRNGFRYYHWFVPLKRLRRALAVVLRGVAPGPVPEDRLRAFYAYVKAFYSDGGDKGLTYWDSTSRFVAALPACS